jgi:hypothetical protein
VNSVADLGAVGNGIALLNDDIFAKVLRLVFDAGGGRTSSRRHRQFQKFARPAIQRAMIVAWLSSWQSAVLARAG